MPRQWLVLTKVKTRDMASVECGECGFDAPGIILELR